MLNSFSLLGNNGTCKRIISNVFTTIRGFIVDRSMTSVTSVDNPANAQRLPETTVASHRAEAEGVLTEQQRQEMIAEFVDQFHVDLYRFTYRLTADSNWSEDIVQNTFLRAFERLEQLKDYKKSSVLAMAIARTTFLGELRKRKSWVFTDAEMNEAEVATVPSSSALDSTNLQQALMEMSEQFRIVLGDALFGRAELS